ncbi:MAG: tetratricopeptide repeat protein [Saprospiraceae bacterium]|nr:tetratricopeptide repeat protein [Saprospiraceae bacterium]
MRVLTTACAILILATEVIAVGYFEYTPVARQAYNQIFSLRFQEARSTLVQLQVEEPDNLILHSLHNYMDCLAIFIGERDDTYAQLRDRKHERLSSIRGGDRGSPYYLYCQADIHLQWAIARVKFEDYFQAVMEIKRAFQLLERNAALFPDFMPNKKNLGILHALVGTVPDQFRWGLRLLGMSGTISQGKAEIEEVLHHAKTNDFVFRDEIYVMYAYLLLHLENQGEEAWNVLHRAKLDSQKNPLSCFVMANVAMQTGRNKVAIDLLKHKPSGDRYFPFPYLSFMEGVARLNRGDEDADEYLKIFLRHTKGKHYIKEAYQKLAWHAIIHDQKSRYFSYLKACKEQGAAVIDEDISALNEARARQAPDRDLLMARVLFDGGYFQQAAAHLESIKSDQFQDPMLDLEYLYRLGRINDALHLYVKALNYYARTIEAGRYERHYFACNAALKSGRIYESMQDMEAAIQHYELALSMHPDQYRASLHQKAKAGLLRISEGISK